MADPLPVPQTAPPSREWGWSAKDLLNRGFYPDEKVDYASGLLQQMWKHSMIGDLVARATGGPKSGYEEVLGDRRATAGGKAAYVAGRVAHDVMSDGSRIPYWFLNHPLAMAGVASGYAAQGAGLTPDYAIEKAALQAKGIPDSQQLIDEIHAKRLGLAHRGVAGGESPSGLARGIVPLIAGTAMVAASGNHDLLNLAQGGRSPGYQAVLPQEGDYRETSSVAGELLSRYIVGRTGRLLPWEEFTVERPDVPREDYDAARRLQFDKGPLGIGLIKGTSRNINGEPEVTMMGFRVPMGAAAAAVGAMGGAIAGSKVADGMVKDTAEARMKQGLLMQSEGEKTGWANRGTRRVTGSALGAIAGAIAARAASQVVNDEILQPAIHPERVAAKDAWLATEVQRTLVQKQTNQLLGATRNANELQQRPGPVPEQLRGSAGVQQPGIVYSQ